jgi:pimeloyl-ACP methyl ester carboxylesterase
MQFASSTTGAKMISNFRGAIDYDEQGSGPTLVLVPGSCSTGAAWRPMIAGWKGHFRCITTSLPGYGGTAERRTTEDVSIRYLAETLETVIRQAGGPVHLIGHSFGGLVALAVALRKQVMLESLVIIEAPATEILRERGEHRHYQTFRHMADAYFNDYLGGNAEAIAAMIDFYGGPGTYASWPQRLRDYAIKTTKTNLLDWRTAFGFSLPAAALETLDVPTLVCIGDRSHPAVQRANDLLSQDINGTPAVAIGGAAHFMIATHVDELCSLVARHVLGAETLRAAA